MIRVGHDATSVEFCVSGLSAVDVCLRTYLVCMSTLEARLYMDKRFIFLTVDSAFTNNNELSENVYQIINDATFAQLYIIMMRINKKAIAI